MRGVAFLLLAGAIWFWALVRAARLFTLEVSDGHIVKVTGQLPARLLAELRDVLERSRLPRARLVAVSRDRLPTLQSNVPLPEGLDQQLRNVLRQFTVQQIRAAGKK
jgi:hypothetical protein